MKKIFLLSLAILCACQKTNDSHNHKHHEKFSLNNKEAKEIHKIAYSLGRQYAANMKEFRFDEESMQIFIQGLEEGHSSTEKLTDEMINYAKKIDQRTRDSRAMIAKDKKIEGEQFVKDLLAEDKGYQQTSTGLVYKIIKEGTKVSEISKEAFFSLKYESQKLDGTVFQTAMDEKGKKYPVRGALKVWQEAFSLCGTGCEVEVISPPSLTYGNHGALPKVAPGEYLKYKLIFVEYFPKGI